MTGILKSKVTRIMAMAILGVLVITVVLPRGAKLPPGWLEAIRQANPSEVIQIIPLSEGETVNVAPPPPPQLPDCSVITGIFGRSQLEEALGGGTTKFVIQDAKGLIIMLGFSGNRVNIAMGTKDVFQYTQIGKDEYLEFLKGQRQNSYSVRTKTESIFTNRQVNNQKVNIERVSKGDLKKKMGFNEGCE